MGGEHVPRRVLAPRRWGLAPLLVQIHLLLPPKLTYIRIDPDMVRARNIHFALAKFAKGFTNQEDCYKLRYIQPQSKPIRRHPKGIPNLP